MSKYIMTTLTTGVKNYEVDGYVKIYGVVVMNLGDGEFDVYDKFSDALDYLMESGKRKSTRVYVDDLDFTGEFILNEMRELGYNSTEDMVNVGDYSMLMSGSKIYSIDILARMTSGRSGVRYLKLVDANKFAPMDTVDICKSYGIELNEVEDVYIETMNDDDVKNAIKRANGLRYAINDILSTGLSGLTLGSASFSDFKKTVNKYNYKFPAVGPREHEYASKAFKGAYNMLSSNHVDTVVENIIKLDINSMFPYIMKTKELPIGRGVKYEGKYKYDERFPLYIARVEVSSFVLKPGKVPTIQDDRGIRGMTGERFIERSIEPMVLYLTNVEYDLMIDSYFIGDIRHIDGFKYRSSVGEFDKFIDKWNDKKEQADIENNEFIRTTTKFIMNYTFGKLGKKSYVINTNVNNEGERSESTVDVGVNYSPAATFITSYAIDMVVDVINQLGDSFVYSDVDSVHFIGETIPSFLIDYIDAHELGKWKIEGIYERSKYLKLKTYINQNSSETVIKAAGAREEIRDKFDFDNFNIGQEFTGEQMPKVVKGGKIYTDYKFKL